MNLFQAMTVLADVHTREDDQLGYVVEMAPSLMLRASRFTESEYTDAWGVIRREAGLPFEPPSSEDSGA
jgi:hypothetical protein